MNREFCWCQIAQENFFVFLIFLEIKFDFITYHLGFTISMI